MHRVVTRASRGQALIETAIALPVFLLVMFGVIWALQTGVLGERVEMVARYGGMVSAEINPYQQYSLYAAYSAAAGSPLTSTCATPPSDLIKGGAPLAAPAAATLPFWQPSQNAIAGATCGKSISNGSGLSAPMLVGHTSITVSASHDVPTTLQPFAGTQTLRQASLTSFSSPAMATLIACYPEMQSAFEHSVDPSTDQSSPVVTPPIASFATGALALGSC